MRPRTSGQKIAGLFGWVLVVFLAATIGAAASINASSFYADLVRPEWAPPAWVFGPVWTVLYALMAVAAWLVWSTGDSRKAGLALIVFLAQLVLNVLWSWLFFRWRLGALAFADTVALLLTLAATIILFWRVRRLAAALLLPYLLWTAFASALSYAVWQLNPQLLG